MTTFLLETLAIRHLKAVTTIWILAQCFDYTLYQYIRGFLYANIHFYTLKQKSQIFRSFLRFCQTYRPSYVFYLCKADKTKMHLKKKVNKIIIFLTCTQELLNNDCVLLLLSTMLTQETGFSGKKKKTDSMGILAFCRPVKILLSVLDKSM